VLTNDYFNITLVGSDGLAKSGSGNNAWFAYVAALNILNRRILFSKTNLLVSKLFEVGTDGKRKSLEKHHLFPKAYLSSNGYSDTKINQMANYAIMKIDKDNDYSSEGRVTIDDPTQFDFRLETGRNNYYNFFVTYEFVKDYPPTSEYEKVLKAEWTGSGFAISDGYIVTNYHVTSGAKNIRVKGIKGDMKESYTGYVVASDKDHDISIIKIVDKDFDSFGTIPYSIGKAAVDMGDDVFVLGYPMTSTMGEGVKLTEGIISSTSGYKGDDSMYQISAAVQPGNSGGPLFNSDGAVIGIVCGKHAEAENANYAVKVSYLYSLVSSSNLGIDISGNNHVNGKSLSTKVKKIRDYVYFIECSSK